MLGAWSDSMRTARSPNSGECLLGRAIGSILSKNGLRDRYGDVEFADTTNHKYPIGSAEHVRAAWRYIQQEDNASKYDKDEVETIKKRIKKAANMHGVEINED